MPCVMAAPRATLSHRLSTCFGVTRTRRTAGWSATYADHWPKSIDRCRPSYAISGVMSSTSKPDDDAFGGARLPLRRLTASRRTSSVTTCAGSTGSGVPAGGAAPAIVAWALVTSAQTASTPVTLASVASSRSCPARERRDADQRAVGREHRAAGAVDRHIEGRRERACVDSGDRASGRGGLPTYRRADRRNGLAARDRRTCVVTTPERHGLTRPECRRVDPQDGDIALVIGKHTRAATFRVGVTCTSTWVAAPTAPRDGDDETRGGDHHTGGVRQWRPQRHDAVLPPDEQIPMVGLRRCLRCRRRCGGRPDLGAVGGEREGCLTASRDVNRLAPLVGPALEHQGGVGLDRVVAGRQRHLARAVRGGHDAPGRATRRVVAHEEHVASPRSGRTATGAHRHRDMQGACRLGVAGVWSAAQKPRDGDDADERARDAAPPRHDPSLPAMSRVSRALPRIREKRTRRPSIPGVESCAPSPSPCSSLPRLP